jgi:dTDP-glucose pyrophosphorylase
MVVLIKNIIVIIDVLHTHISYQTNLSQQADIIINYSVQKQIHGLNQANMKKQVETGSGLMGIGTVFLFMNAIVDILRM